MTFQKRIIEEQKELAIKLRSLSDFKSSELFMDLHCETRMDLIEQFHYMKGYNCSLLKRIERFPAKVKAAK
jgi:hypothetical protein